LSSQFTLGLLVIQDTTVVFMKSAVTDTITNCHYYITTSLYYAHTTDVLVDFSTKISQ